MNITEDQMNHIAQFALRCGLDPEFEEKIRKCDCDSCKSAAVILDIVGGRMRAIVEADGVRLS